VASITQHPAIWCGPFHDSRFRMSDQNDCCQRNPITRCRVLPLLRLSTQSRLSANQPKAGIARAHLVSGVPSGRCPEGGVTRGGGRPGGSPSWLGGPSVRAAGVAGFVVGLAANSVSSRPPSRDPSNSLRRWGDGPRVEPGVTAGGWGRRRATADGSQDGPRPAPG
jgi:hypothetical protein